MTVDLGKHIPINHKFITVWFISGPTEMGSCSSNGPVINQLIDSQEIISGTFEWGLCIDSLGINGFDITVKLRPTEPHSLAWGSTNFHTKIFQLEHHRLKMDAKIIDSLSNLPLLIQYIFPILLCKFHIVLPKVHKVNPDFFVPWWRMPPGLLCFGHVDGIAIC